MHAFICDLAGMGGADLTWTNMGQAHRYVAFNAYAGGTRRVYVADLSELV